jgi:Na+/melibiose symporter-like transporter
MDITGVSPARPPTRPFSLYGRIAISAIWLAWYTQWVSIPSIILPNQVTGLLGVGARDVEGVTGAVVAAGSVVALLVPPLAGALSDSARSRFGRRRPFLAVGVIASSLALVGLFLAARLGLALYVLAYINLQFWWNWAAGPGAGFIPDVVPSAQQASASGWTNALGVVGVVIGSVLVNLLYSPAHMAELAAAFVAINLACLALTLSVREAPAAGARMARSLGAFFSSFFLSPREHPNFYLVLGTRFLSNMGIWSVLTFLLLYLESVLGQAPAAATWLLSIFLGGGACLAVPASLIGARMADRFGLVRVVQIASWVMAAATGAYVLIALHPSVALIAPAIVLFSVGNGAYGAVDWLLALRVLPSGQDAGKDFGVWHACMVAPQIIAPLTTGLLITLIRDAASARLAYEVAFAIGALWFVLAAALVGRVRVPEAVGG